MSDKRIDFLSAMDRVAPAGEAPGFGKRLGPTEQCFSPRDLVNLFEWGASVRESAHIDECDSCARWVHTYAQKPQLAYMPKVAAAHAGLRGTIAKLFQSAVPAIPEPATVLLLAGQRILTVSKPGAAMGEWSLPVVAGLKGDMLSRIDLGSLTLEGCIVGGEASLVAPNPAGLEWWEKYPSIRFKGVQPSSQARQDLGKSFGLTNQIRVTGRFTDSADQFFRGQAVVTLKKS